MVWRLFIAGLDTETAAGLDTGTAAGLDTGIAAGQGLVDVGDVCLLGIGTVDVVGVQLCASEGLLARHEEALREVVGIAASISDIAPCLAGEVLRGLAKLEMRGLADWGLVP